MHQIWSRSMAGSPVRERNREAVVDAIMVLVKSGETEPTMAHVAEVAALRAIDLPPLRDP